MKPVVGGRSVLAYLAVMMTCACSGSAHPETTLSSGSSDTEQTSAAPIEGCEIGSLRECTIQLPSHAGVTHCARGIEECTEMGWTACHAPSSDAGSPDAPSPTPFVPESDSNP
jgi:hypothetical protein